MALVKSVWFVAFAILMLAGCDSREEKADQLPEMQADGEAESDEPDVSITLEAAQMDWVGAQIFRNECAGQLDCLVHWNVGEKFPSLGIGHFIWYPSGVEGRFVESFPALIQYMRQRQASVPEWLRELEPFDAPWPDRESFLAAQDSVEVAELREFLAGTQGVQAEFIVRRAKQSLTDVVAAAPEGQRHVVQRQLKSLTATPGGIYALMDYVNFKGEGLSQTERYKGEGWGLLQVLLAMDSESNGQSVLDRFREAAERVLRRRAENAENPIERDQWLSGWLKRLETYKEPAEMKAAI